ncbi:hypothetical protein C8R44DRAFT_856662 [Mycena epipterygia]|nr:hypothetical protein C8R44DRAFT_856662 [Mycena epipterygia]
MGHYLQHVSASLSTSPTMNGWIIDLQLNTKSICDTGSLRTDSGALWGQGTKDMYMPTAGVAAFLQPRTATPSLGRHTQAAHAQPAGKCAGASARAACVGRAALAHARVPPSAHPKTQEQQGNRATPSRRPQTDMVGLKEYLKEQVLSKLVARRLRKDVYTLKSKLPPPTWQEL